MRRYATSLFLIEEFSSEWLGQPGLSSPTQMSLDCSPLTGLDRPTTAMLIQGFSRLSTLPRSSSTLQRLLAALPVPWTGSVGPARGNNLTAFYAIRSDLLRADLPIGSPLSVTISLSVSAFLRVSPTVATLFPRCAHGTRLSTQTATASDRVRLTARSANRLCVFPADSLCTCLLPVERSHPEIYIHTPSPY